MKQSRNLLGAASFLFSVAALATDMEIGFEKTEAQNTMLAHPYYKCVQSVGRSSSSWQDFSSTEEMVAAIVARCGEPPDDYVELTEKVGAEVGW